MQNGPQEELIKTPADNGQEIKKESKPQRERSTPAFRLTARDYQIMRFLLDQKFASLEAVYLRFFDRRPKPDVIPPRELFTTRQRLALLKRAGLITTQRVYSEPKSLYLITIAGYRVLSGKMPEAAFATPMREVDFRSFEHDSKVTVCRIALERTGKARWWYPERRVRMQGFSVEREGQSYGLSDTIIPDGIFLNSKGERVALELEASARKKSRFIFKIDEYASILRSSVPVVEKVLFIVVSRQLYRDLKAMTHGKEGFFVDFYEHYLESVITARAMDGMKSSEIKAPSAPAISVANEVAHV